MTMRSYIIMIVGVLLLMGSCQSGQAESENEKNKAKVLAYIDQIYKSE